jgi:polyisoprenoid-binding protein YceI
MSKIMGLILALSLSTTVFAADSYKIDPVHSTIGFSVKHMMVSNVRGQFDQYEGQIVYDSKNLAGSKINVIIQSSSIDTRNEKRDEHLKTADFFDVSKFPTITFVSKKISPTEIIGDLTVKGITKEITIPATITGPVKGMKGDLLGVEGTFTLNRQDYGITYSKVLDQGGLAVSNDVVVNISIEADKEEPAKEAEKK